MYLYSKLLKEIEDLSITYKFIPLHLKSNIITVVNNELIGNNKLEYYTRKSNG